MDVVHTGLQHPFEPVLGPLDIFGFHPCIDQGIEANNICTLGQAWLWNTQNALANTLPCSVE